LKQYYLSAVSPALQNTRNVLTQLRTALADSTEKVDELMVMQEMPKPKKHIFYFVEIMMLLVKKYFLIHQNPF